MSSINYLFLGNVAVWLGIGVYAFFLGLRQKRLETRVRQLEAMEK